MKQGSSSRVASLHVSPMLSLLAASVLAALPASSILGAALAPPAAVMPARVPAGAPAAPGAQAVTVARNPPATPFEPGQVIELARKMAQSPQRPAEKITPGLENVTYDQYRDLRFKIDQSIWTKANSPFRVDLLPAGFVFKSPVTVSIIENGQSTDQVSNADMWDLGPSIPKNLRNVPLSLSGFRVRSRINTRAYWDEFLVFQGASYFRAVGRGQAYGLSSRGLALRTAEPGGEEFPAFTHFWLEKPAPRATSLVIHALLDSPSVTGAYRFVVQAGADSSMDVEFTLFPRVDLRVVGIAPLTSMFLFDSTNKQRFDDFRFRVHDSDGLLIETKSGERIWRPLANPKDLQLSAFTTEAPKSFGLMQRAKLLADYQDLEASYEKRPSAWVEPIGDWGAGPVRLVEIPSRRETNDNIVVFWQPRDVLPAGKPYHGAYRMHWSVDPLPPQGFGRVVASRVGTSFDGERKLFVVDIQGAGAAPEGLKLEVTSSAGKVSNPVIQTNPTIKGLRASFELAPGDAQLAELRLVVRKGDKPAAETWLYRWTST